MNILNLSFAVEIVYALVGSFGVVLMAPATAVVEGFLLRRESMRVNMQYNVEQMVDSFR